MQGDKIIDKMLDRFNYVIKEIEKENNIKIKDEDIDKLISMASVIEKEAEKIVKEVRWPLYFIIE